MGERKVRIISVGIVLRCDNQFIIRAHFVCDSTAFVLQVLNKHVPADFDPALVPRGSKLSKKDGTVPVRMMLPFSIQCDTCNTFLYRGRKFNSKKEAVQGPEGRYLGIQRWRFYIKCTHCSRTVTFLTDPKNADYEMESGGTRNYEVYKDKEKTEEGAAIEKEEEEKS